MSVLNQVATGLKVTAISVLNQVATGLRVTAISVLEVATDNEL